jgi:dTMP kinase
MKQGLYIVIDGLDGAGKGEVFKALAHHYPDINTEVSGVSKGPLRVKYKREPGGTELGEEIREMILNKDMDPVTEFFLFLAQRKEVRNSISAILAQGICVISDRSDSSTFAFQIVGRELSQVEPLFWNAQKLFNPKPDLYIILDLPAEVAKARTEKRKIGGGDSDRIDDMPLAFHERVRQGFHFFCENVDVPHVFIDATKSPEEVAYDVVNTVTNLFHGRPL